MHHTFIRTDASACTDSLGARRLVAVSPDKVGPPGRIAYTRECERCGLRQFSRFLFAVFATMLIVTGVRADTPVAAMPVKKAVVFVIPVNGEIADPILYILRRGLKDAIAQKADLVVLDMDTLGGSAATALDMMDALNK